MIQSCNKVCNIVILGVAHRSTRSIVLHRTSREEYTVLNTYYDVHAVEYLHVMLAQ